MELINKILQHPQFIKYLKLNAKEEKQRKFCHHDLQHALDVARVAYIVSMEKGFNIDTELIYIAALLHDIAKWKQYREKIDHAIEGAILAEEILRDIGVNELQIEMILDAIRNHRNKSEKKTPLSEVLYAGDKACRLCITCKSINECNRFENGKQPILEY